jgi:hypothetical protein
MSGAAAMSTRSAGGLAKRKAMLEEETKFPRSFIAGKELSV